MEKAWDKAQLIEDLKEQGLPMAEVAIAKVVRTTFEWADKSVKIEGGWIQVIGEPTLRAAKEFLMRHIDRIDGVENR